MLEKSQLISVIFLKHNNGVELLQMQYLREIVFQQLVNQEIIWVKGNQMWKLRVAAAEKALNQPLDPQLLYKLFQTYIM